MGNSELEGAILSIGLCLSNVLAYSFVIEEDGSIIVRSPLRPGRINQQGHIFQPRLQHSKPSTPTAMPWWPFTTHADFRFARLALSAGMNASQIDEDLAIHHLASDSHVTFRSADELRKVQTRAERLLTPYRRVDYSVPLRGSSPTKDLIDCVVWIMPLMDWILELVLNPEIQKHLHFDSIHKLRKTDGQWVRCVDEPWTADAWSAIQARLPDDGLPICIILYADKALASSFGTKKLYPIIARLGNLPRSIRNARHGVGAGRVVGLLPVLDKAPAGVSASAFANFKCNVWHRGVEKLLDTIRMESLFGYAVELELHRSLNLEKKRWLLFPDIPIVAADLEEQFIMGCLRGTNSVCPCPRCLESGDFLFDLLRSAKLRHSKDVRELMEQAKSSNVTQTKALLHEHSYRPVDNAFMVLSERTDIYQALSYDTLHNDDLGCWGSHLWETLKDYIAENCPPGTSTDFENKIDAVPPWPDLNHYPNALRIAFSDGTKYEDLLRVVLHGTMALPDHASVLVELIRVQAEIRLLGAFEVHTEETVSRGRELVRKFDKLSKACTKRYGNKFNFPKMHMACHLFDDIWQKGAPANFSTKPSEQMHGGLRHAYGMSSKKSSTVDKEILDITQAAAAYELIQAEIDEFTNCAAVQTGEEVDKDDSEEVFHHRSGSRGRATSLELFEAKHADNAACYRLASRIKDFIFDVIPDFIGAGESFESTWDLYLTLSLSFAKLELLSVLLGFVDIINLLQSFRK
ncbi:hypothetical protein RhiJN_28107 [Ceratobasidium sp. AG-Ba]|nr:hypothetical protein RhiJN_28107 [Ceratobasidium sp. AG-Ba]